MRHQIQLSTRGRLTIPKALRDKHGFEPGRTVEWIIHDGAIEVRLKPTVVSLTSTS
jgi:AbrB family looped-hinge helix DNA binding protein